MQKPDKFFLILALILVVSCSSNGKETPILQFNAILGKENVSTLDFLVSDFENDFLQRQYPNLKTEKAYLQFLTELRNNKTVEWKSVSQIARAKFDSSDLRVEIYEFPDSVWIFENSSFDKIESDSIAYLESSLPYIKSRFKFTDEEGRTEYTYSRTYGEISSNSNYDSIIKREINSPRFNYTGKYLQALELIKNTSDFQGKLYEVKESVGIMDASEMAKMMLSYDIDLNDELNKRLIILELAY